MEVLNKIVTLYAYDNLRGDGFAVRFTRLSMYQPNVISLLCWSMELSFYLAYYRHGCTKVLSMLSFVSAYILVLALVY